LQGDEFTVFGNGHQTRDFTYVTDAVDGTLAAAEHGRPGRVYNVGGGSCVSMRDVLSAIDGMAGPLRVTYAETQRGDARNTAADITRAASELGFRPRHNLEEGLRAQLRWQLEAREFVGVD